MQIKELRDFYLFNDKLLYVSKEFIGYDPLISKGLSFEKSERGAAETTRHDTFEMGGPTLFYAMLSSFICGGPLRGHERIKILKNGRTIINYEWGSRGHGTIYTGGNDYKIENRDAFLVRNGHAMRERETDTIYRNFSPDHQYLFWSDR